MCEWYDVWCWYGGIWFWLVNDTEPQWVQAIGSLFGLAIAIAVPALQHRRDQKAEERRLFQEQTKNLARARVMLLDARAMMNELKTYSGTRSEPTMIKAATDKYETIEKDFRELFFCEFPNVGAIMFILKIANLSEQIRTSIGTWLPAGPIDVQQCEKWERIMEGHSERLREFHLLFEKNPMAEFPESSDE